ncbi:MAG: DUF4440 domain-containing protein [Burkholderiales bacterium]|nr:DUF4440 domain-containing protein [Burkholderiales bacterium]
MRGQYCIAASLILLALAGTAAHAAPESQTELLKRLSQAFSDASASGDKAVLEKSLDDHVVFMNETGQLATKKDIVDSATPPRSGMHQTLTQVDWQVQFHEDVAVTSFTDESDVELAGQHLLTRYLSTEVWKKKGNDWLMIASQTMVAPSDPPAVTLPAAVLDQYVGTYKADDHFVLTLSRRGDALVGQINGGEAYPIQAEVQDVLFTPGQPQVRRIIQRDAAGKVTGLISRRDGHDLRLKRVG